MYVLVRNLAVHKYLESNMNLWATLEIKTFEFQLEIVNKVLYMSFDKFLLDVESRDLSQAEKSIISFFFTKMSDG